MGSTTAAGPELQIRNNLATEYSDIYTPQALAALSHMAQFTTEQKRLMDERTRRRLTRMRDRQAIGFLAAEAEIRGTGIKCRTATSAAACWCR